MNSRLRAFVIHRAYERCEYCHLAYQDGTLDFHVEHILPRVHGGDDSEQNLAYSCSRCNTHKGVNLAGIDPDTGLLTCLYNPRVHDWVAHFELAAGIIHGTTDIGRTTVRVLRMNDDLRVRLRTQLIPGSDEV